MSGSDWICKVCGSSDIIASVEVHTPTEMSGRVRERNGKPYFAGDDFEFSVPDYDVTGYVCECGATAAKIEELVVRRRARDEMQLPCGRCDHAAHEHPQVGKFPARDGFTRPPMPCTVGGCDCHDYFDSALALTSSWDRPGQEVLA